VKVCGFHHFCIVVFCMVISACGGGGSSSESSAVDDNFEPDPEYNVDNSESVLVLQNENTAMDLNQSPRIEAIDNYLVEEGEEFQVVAVADDPDGQVVEYRWAQLKGPQLELFDTKSAVLTLRAPYVYFDTPMLFELVVTDNQGKTATEQFTLTVAQSWNRFLLTGTVSFERVMHDLSTDLWDMNHVLQQPAREVLVELMAGDEVLDSTYTDIYGIYEFLVPSYEDHPKVRVRVSARLESGATWLVEVKDNTSYNEEEKIYPLYSLESEEIDLEKATVVSDEDLASEAAFDEWLSQLVVNFNSDKTSREAAPFAVLDTLYSIMQVLHNEWDSTVVFPKLTVFWSIKNTAVNGAFNEGEVGGAYYGNQTIVLKGDITSDAEEYDEMVIAHEYGHYFHNIFSRSNSVGERIPLAIT